MERIPLHIFRLFLFIGLLFSSVLHAQEAQDEDDFFADEEFLDDEIADPFEPINRMVFYANDKLFRVVLSPAVGIYQIVPEPARVSVSNFYENLTAPISAINAVLQLDMENAGSELSRFIINSTVGVLGLFDPASRMGIVQDREDLGQTLAHYGIGHGFYMVVPILGFYSLRDFGAKLGESTLNPINQVWDPDLKQYIVYQGIDGINDLSFNIENYISLYDSALDPYIFFRSAYVQNRAGAVAR